MVDKILVPIDGSEQSDKALMKALEIAEAEDADLDLFHVVERQPLPYGEYPFTKYPLGWVKGMPGFTDPRRYPQWAKSFNESYIEHAEHYFSQALKKVKQKKSRAIETNLEIATGNPVDRILDKIEEGDYDMVIMGSTGLGAVGRFLLGSVSTRVKSETEIPVKFFNEDGEEVSSG